MQKLIIGCGYLGRRVARHWVAQGDVVHALTRSTANADALCALGVRPIRGDVTELGSLQSLPDVETVLYAVGLDRSAGKSQRTVYVDGLANVLSRLAAGASRFLYISSTSVYGQNAGEWVDEGSVCEPTSSNGQVCLDAESLLRQQLPAAMILRLAGIYGPGRLVARIEQLRAGAALEGNPEAWLNLIHVYDAVASIVACEQRGTAGSLYLVSDDHPHPRREYYALLASQIGAPAPMFATESLGEDERLGFNKRCRNRRLHDELKVALRYPSIAEGLRAAIPE